MGLLAAGASLDDTGHLERSLRVNDEARSITHEVLDELGLERIPTHANFVMHRVPGDVDAYIARMREHDVRVGRPFPPMLGHNRLSFGLPDEMERFGEVLRGFRRRGWV
jgi:histidinol-phosphate aminotransferase